MTPNLWFRGTCIFIQQLALRISLLLIQSRLLSHWGITERSKHCYRSNCSKTKLLKRSFKKKDCLPTIRKLNHCNPSFRKGRIAKTKLKFQLCRIMKNRNSIWILRSTWFVILTWIWMYNSELTISWDLRPRKNRSCLIFIY